MTATLIKGTEIREQILEEITAEVAEIKEKHGKVPGLVTILVGENPASVSYVTLKIKTAHRVGFKEIQDNQSPDIAEEDLLLRGPGEFFGTKQSGLAYFQLADLSRDKSWLELARQKAKSLLERDPSFKEPEHRQLRLEYEYQKKRFRA